MHTCTQIRAFETFAAAFIDMKMPGPDGAETSRQILQIEPHIKIVIVTAFSEKKPKDIIQIIGRDDIFYLRKPFNPEEIRQFARALTNQWKIEQEKKALAEELARVNADPGEMNINFQQKVPQKRQYLPRPARIGLFNDWAAEIVRKIQNPVEMAYQILVARQTSDPVIQEILKLYDDLLDALEKNDAEKRNLQIKAIRQFKNNQQVEVNFDAMIAATAESLEGLKQVQEMIRNKVKL